MNVCDTSSHGDTLMCEIWLANVKPKKKLQAGHESVQTTNVRTDRHTTEGFLFPPELRSQGPPGIKSIT